jgi:tryptophan 2,3-dioxygenase
MQHLNVAIKYIEHSGKGTGEATGGSDWKIHAPKIPAIFFPELWSAEELANWCEI